MTKKMNRSDLARLAALHNKIRSTERAVQTFREMRSEISHDLDLEFEDVELELERLNKKLEADRNYYRDQATLQSEMLREARNKIAQLQARVDLLSKLSDPRLLPEPNDAVKAFIAENKRIEAIKNYRTQSGLNLKEAKDAIDHFFPLNGKVSHA